MNYDYAYLITSFLLLIVWLPFTLFDLARQTRFDFESLLFSFAVGGITSALAQSYPLRPEVSALLMSVSSIIVATNAVLLNRAEKDLLTI